MEKQILGRLTLGQTEKTTLRDRDIWLSSFFGFDPDSWGCFSFSKNWMRDRFMAATKPGALVCVYVTKSNGPAHMRGKLVGLLEVSHDKGSLREFVSKDQLQRRDELSSSGEKWEYALRATRAWKIVPEEWPDISEFFPKTYGGANSIIIGARGVPVDISERLKLASLTVQEVSVYGQNVGMAGHLNTLENALKPSRAVYPAKEPYFVGETDGPKYLYILRLNGDISAWFGDASRGFGGKHIVKVGFSKSPLTRCAQIQAPYPRGQFQWEIWYPDPIPQNAPFLNAETAIVAENAMKQALVKSGAESLGGEFFLADVDQVVGSWSAGVGAAKI